LHLFKGGIKISASNFFYMKPKYIPFEQALKKRIEQEKYRQLRCMAPIDEAHWEGLGKGIRNFASNDFLGLAEHSEVKKRTIQYVLEWGTGSRSQTSYIDQIEKTQKKLAAALETETALLFPSLFQARTALISAIAGPRGILYIDSLSSPALTQAASAAGATVRTFSHGDYDALAAILHEHKGVHAKSQLVLLESLGEFSGMRAPLDKLISIVEESDALLAIDDAQAFSVLGDKGMGLCAKKPGIDFILGTFSKAYGAYGAYMGVSTLMRDYLACFSEALVSKSALPPAALGAIDAALDLIPSLNKERTHISSLSAWLKKGLTSLGYALQEQEDHFFTLEIPHEELFDLSETLLEGKIATSLVRAKNGAMRLKLAVNALQEEEEINALLETLDKSLSRLLPV